VKPLETPTKRDPTVNTQNQLVQNTREAGIALRAGDMNQLRELARTIGKAGGAVSLASAADLGNKPSQLTEMTRKAGNQSDANHRAVYHDRPPPGHGHSR
jgi:general stress protein YciG